MGEQRKKISEKGAELYRNINAATALGAIAVGAIFPATAIVMYPVAAFNAVQAAGVEVAKRHLAKKHSKNT